MRLPMVGRKMTVTRSYSGRGYGSSTDDSGDQQQSLAEELSASAHQQQQHLRIGRRNKAARRSKKKQPESSSSSDKNAGAAAPSRATLLWLFLTLGLLFCLLDVLYILNHVMQQRDVIDSNSHNVALSAGAVADQAALIQKQDAAHRTVQTLPSDWIGDDKGPVLKLLEEAVGEVDTETAERLPTAEEVTALYGRGPVVLGLETCEQFRGNGDPAEHFVSTAGSFNTGTNLMAELLIANCVLPARMQKYGTKGVRWQVVWGKHTPIDNEEFRVSHRTYTDGSVTAGNMFPAVMVRDPFKWMQSMCRHAYGADWPHDPAHCPNLIPNEVDLELLQAETEHSSNMTTTATMNVTVNYAEFSQHHASLVEFWNDWNRAYVQAKFPRLIVRFEDVVFHPKQMTQTVCECAGGQLNPGRPFQFIVDSAKKGAAHGKEKTSYVDALIKYGTEAGRYSGFEAADLEYATAHLDPDLMRLFGYNYPPSS